jgi:hypothetical protein
MGTKLRAGAAKVDITPAVGTALCGHFRPDLRSSGIHSSLFAKTLVIRDGENTAAIVSCDLIGVTSTFVASTRQRISDLWQKRNGQLYSHTFWTGKYAIEGHRKG